MKKLLITLHLIACVLLVNNASAFAYQTSSEMLTLNKGAKWKVDNSTNNNVKHLQEIVQAFNTGKDKSLNAYHKTASDLQAGLNKMIKECKMKGADHQALHKWLEPFMGQVTKFAHTTKLGKAAQSLDGIKVHLNKFNQYFEL